MISEDKIIEFSRDIINESLPKFKTDFNNFIEKQIGEVIKDVENFQNKENDSRIDKKSKKEIEDIIKNYLNEKKIEELREKAFLLFSKDCIEKICSDCIKELILNSKSVYDRMMEDKKFKEFITDQVIKEFEEIKDYLKFK